MPREHHVVPGHATIDGSLPNAANRGLSVGFVSAKMSRSWHNPSRTSPATVRLHKPARTPCWERCRPAADRAGHVAALRFPRGAGRRGPAALASLHLQRSFHPVAKDLVAEPLTKMSQPCAAAVAAFALRVKQAKHGNNQRQYVVKRQRIVDLQPQARLRPQRAARMTRKLPSWLAVSPASFIQGRATPRGSRKY